MGQIQEMPMQIAITCWLEGVGIYQRPQTSQGEDAQKGALLASSTSTGPISEKTRTYIVGSSIKHSTTGAEDTEKMHYTALSKLLLVVEEGFRCVTDTLLLSM